VGVKSTSYLVHYLLWELAKQQGRIDDLLEDDRGMISEATVSNVFVVRAGRLLTPPVSEGLLPGITRETVLELAAAAELPVSEEPLPRADLAHVDECFLTGAAKGVVPVDELDGRVMPTRRPVAEALQAALVARVAAECDIEVASVRF
jgi:branched-chain amino acid aminotransferase